ncbi:uncharacterized protein [Nicotiana sylvestris]|uniref:uncharacterized protein n=1 Tax=Nicotiana sylvestris TaxID=4096 RepID=UPI00388CC1E6
MIFEGNEINRVTFSVATKTNVFITHSKGLRELDKDNITFTKEDENGLLLLYNGALVISLNVLDFKIKRVLVDPGRLTYIIQWRVLKHAILIRSIVSATKLLAIFNLVSMTTLCEIVFPTNAKRVMKTTLFEVVDCDMEYNIILGRPWLHEMIVVPSTYHQLLKYSAPEGVKQIRDDQPATKEMKAILVSSSKEKEHAT